VDIEKKEQSGVKAVDAHTLTKQAKNLDKHWLPARKLMAALF
jgi:ribosomal protein S15P/S13E